MAPVLFHCGLFGWCSHQITARCHGSWRSVLGSTDRSPIRSSRWRVYRAGPVEETSRRPLADRSSSATAPCGLGLGATAGRARARPCPVPFVLTSDCLRSVREGSPGRVAPGGTGATRARLQPWTGSGDGMPPRAPASGRGGGDVPSPDRPPYADRAWTSSCPGIRGRDAAAREHKCLASASAVGIVATRLRSVCASRVDGWQAERSPTPVRCTESMRGGWPTRALGRGQRRRSCSGFPRSDVGP